MPVSIRIRLALAAAALIAGAALYSPTKAAPDLQKDFREFLYEGHQVVPLQPTVLKIGEMGTAIEERVRITTETDQDPVVRILRPKAPGKYPTVVVQHFLGADKDDASITLLLGMFVSRGFLVAAIDGRYRGERGKDRSLTDAISGALKTGKGHPWLVDTVYDVFRTIDYLETRPDVDAKRIGMAGVSEGGLITWMAAAADPRIRTAASMIGVTRLQYVIDAATGPAGEAYRKSFDAALVPFAKQIGEDSVNERVVRKAWDILLPGFTSRFDAVYIVPLIAPRPFLILAHENDEIIPLKGTREVYDAARKRYEEVNAADKLELRITPKLKHAAVDFTEITTLLLWFDRWLKPAPTSA